MSNVRSNFWTRPTGPRRAGSAVVGSAVVGSAVVGSAVVGSAVDGSAVVGSAIDGSAVDGSAVVGSAVDGSAVDGSAVVGSAVDGSAVDGSAVVGSAAAPSLGTGSDDATSTASRLAIFWNALGSFVFARCGGYKKARDFTRAGHRVVQSALLLSLFCSTGGIQADVYPTDTSQWGWLRHPFVSVLALWEFWITRFGMLTD